MMRPSRPAETAWRLSGANARSQTVSAWPDRVWSGSREFVSPTKMVPSGSAREDAPAVRRNRHAPDRCRNALELNDLLARFDFQKPQSVVFAAGEDVQAVGRNRDGLDRARDAWKARGSAFPDSRSQRRTMPSSQPVTARLPSG